MYVQRNIEACSLNHCCCVEAISITYSEFVCEALFIQHAKCMLHIILSSVSCLAVRYLIHKWHEFVANVIEHKNVCYFYVL